MAIVTPTLAAMGGTESIAQQTFASIEAHADVVYVVPRHQIRDDGRRYAPVAAARWPHLDAVTAWYNATDRAVSRLRPRPDIVFSPGANTRCATHIEIHAVFAQWRDNPAPAAWDAVAWSRRRRFARLARIEACLLNDRRVRVATVSAAAAAELARYYGRDDVTVLWPAPDPQRFCPSVRMSPLREATRRAYGVEDGRPVFLTLGNAWWSKGFDRLLAAMRDPRLTAAELWIVSLERRSRVARRVGGLPANVRWLPRIDNIEALYAAADAVLLASRGETFGLPIAEAGLMAVPVRVSAHAGVAARVPKACVVGDTNGAWADALAALVTGGDDAALTSATRAALAAYSPADRRRDLLAWLGLA